MKQLHFLALIIVPLFYSCTGQKELQVSTDAALLQTIEQSFTTDAAQYKVMMKNVPPDKFPKNYDPKKTVVSTAHVALQQRDWYETNGTIKRVPAELQRIVSNQISGLISLEEAKTYRKQLMKERSALNDEVDEKVYKHIFSFCEH